MKARRTHAVPLSRQVLELLTELKAITGGQGYIFPAFHTRLRPMSENTINSSFRRMGYSKDEMTAHGFRSTASTLLNESGLWHPDAIERALAHGDSNAIRGTYNRGQYWDERVKMAQWWSDHLDDLRAANASSS
jgi:integrase